MAKSLLLVAVGLGLSSASCFSVPSMASESVIQDSADGEFRFQLKDYWLGQQAKLSYQVTPRLNLSWRYDEFDLPEQQIKSGSQYNARWQIFAESRLKLAFYVSAHDFLADQNRRSYGIYAQKRLSDWHLALGYADGDGLDGMQANVRYSGFAPYVEFEAVYHAQQDWNLNHSLHDSVNQKLLKKSAPQWHVGASWQRLKWAKLGIQYDEFGEMGLSASLLFDSKRVVSSKRFLSNANNIDAEVVSQVFSDDERQSKQKLSKLNKDQASAIIHALAAVDIALEALAIEQGLLMIVVSADDYAYWPDAIVHAQYVMNRLLPKSIDAVEYIITQHGHALYSTREVVVHIDGVAGNLANSAVSSQRMRLKPLSLNQVELANAKRFRWLPDLSVRLDNAFYQPQGDEQHSVLSYYWGGTLSADWSLGQDWQIETAIQADFSKDFGVESARVIGIKESNLIPLRSAHQQRQIDDDVRFTKALLSKRGSVIKTQRNQYSSYHYNVFAGQISSELHGFGGQVLYQMWQSRVAVGINFAQLVVSDTERLAQLHVSNQMNTAELSTEHTSTGTVSAYWASPWHNIDVSLEAGQFIGRDKGALVNIKRTFQNGWQFGLYAARTRLNGEYFTNSGLQLAIPLNALFDELPSSVRSALDGQKLRYSSGIHSLGNNTAYSLSELTSDMWWQQRDVRYDVFTQVRH